MAFTKLLWIIVGTIVVGVGASALTAWGVSSSILAGYDGAQGQAGDSGQDGADGTAGAVGATGTPGIKGADGSTGARGPAGADTGIVGPAGPRGATGAAGAPGAAGASLPAAQSYGPVSGSAVLPIDGTAVTLSSSALTPGTYIYSVYSGLTVSNFGPWDTVTCGNDLVTIYFDSAGTKILKEGGVTVEPTATTFDITCVAGNRLGPFPPSSTTIEVAWTDLAVYTASAR